MYRIHWYCRCGRCLGGCCWQCARRTRSLRSRCRHLYDRRDDAGFPHAFRKKFPLAPAMALARRIADRRLANRPASRRDESRLSCKGSRCRIHAVVLFGHRFALFPEVRRNGRIAAEEERALLRAVREAVKSTEVTLFPLVHNAVAARFGCCRLLNEDDGASGFAVRFPHAILLSQCHLWHSCREQYCERSESHRRHP